MTLNPCGEILLGQFDFGIQWEYSDSTRRKRVNGRTKVIKHKKYPNSRNRIYEMVVSNEPTYIYCLGSDNLRTYGEPGV